MHVKGRPSARPTPRRRRRRVRLRRSLIPRLGRAVAWAGVLLALAWVMGVILNDRTPWSQYLWWIPAPAVAVATWAAFGFSQLADAVSSRLSGTVARPFVLLGALAATFTIVAGWHPLRALGSGPQLRVEDAQIVYWNAAWSVPTGARDRLDALEPDVLIVANPRPSSTTRELHDWMRSRAIAWREEAGTERATHLVRLRQIVIISRWPITASGVARLGAGAAGGSVVSRATQNGIGFAVIERSEGPALRLHVVDLPSDPTWHRRDMLEEVRRTRDAWRGQEAEGQLARFPEADVLIGDFNTPRGSESLEILTMGLNESHAAVGTGSPRTFPLPLPCWAIDLAHVGRNWRPITADTRGLGVGFHKAITVRVRPAGVAARR